MERPEINPVWLGCTRKRDKVTKAKSETFGRLYLQEKDLEATFL
jgi:hypothetical protein